MKISTKRRNKVINFIENKENNKSYYDYEKIELSSQINSLMKNDYNNKIEELVTSLTKYKSDVQKMIKFDIKIPHYKFKKTIFKQIELLLTQIGDLDNKELREQQINSLYKWYKNKMNFYYALSSINKLTYNKKDEKIHDFKNNSLNNKKTNESSENGLNHRTVMTYKKINYYLNEFRRRHIKVKKTLNNGIINIELKRQIKNEKNNRSLYKNKSDFNKHYTLKKTDIKSINGLIPKYEIKSSYSIERPEFNISSLKIEKRINRLKNKLISEKKNQIEMEKYIEDFGKSRAIYKSNINKSHEIKNIIKKYKLFQNSYLETKNNINNNTKEIEKNDVDKDKDKIEKEETIRINKIHLNKIKNINKDNLLITSLQHNKCNKKNERSNDKIDSFINNINEKDENEKLNIKYIKSKIFITNSDENDKQTKEAKEDNKILVDIQCELPKIKSNENLLSTKKDEDDAIMKNITNNPIYSSKRRVVKLCSIRDRNNNMNNSSNYSLSNVKYMNDNRICDSYEYPSFSNLYDYAKHKLFSSMDNNYLHVKKGFNSFKRNEFLRLTKVIKNKDHFTTLNKTALYDAFIDPKNTNVYSNYYLPKYNGNSLLRKMK